MPQAQNNGANWAWTELSELVSQNEPLFFVGW